jgi:hypothetical protein
MKFLLQILWSSVTYEGFNVTWHIPSFAFSTEATFTLCSSILSNMPIIGSVEDGGSNREETHKEMKNENKGIQITEVRSTRWWMNLINVIHLNVCSAR